MSSKWEVADNVLDQVRDVVKEFEDDPRRATVSSREVANCASIDQRKATVILHELEKRGEVRLWSADGSVNPKWVVGGAT